ncbi:MAG TPA: hypothetical protein VG722_13625, partial [Tepidisphaeraceae bacterium]|nr:hypothetical protein [Tepidisphaeraceae bacterium]
MTYRYETKDSAGHVESGVIHAPNLSIASQQLRAAGRMILSLQPTEDNKRKFNFKDLNVSFGPGAKDVQHFTGQLAV